MQSAVQSAWWRRFLGLTLWPVLAAAAAPGAGDLLRDAPVPVRPPPRSADQALPNLPAGPEAADQDGPRIRVSAVRLVGVQTQPVAEVQALVDDARGRELSLKQLQALADRVSAFYRARGYLLARAYLFEQRIQDGVVELVVFEGRLGRVHLDLTPPVTLDDVQPRLSALTPGQPLLTAPLEHSLLVLSDLPGVQVQSLLRPGQVVGTSDLDVRVRRDTRTSGSVSIDNHGNRSTGEWRLGAQLNIASPWRFGDSLELSAATSGRNYQYGRVGWLTPVGSAGTQAGLAGSVMRYRLGREFEALDAEGRAGIVTLQAVHPLLRSRDTTLQASAAFDIKRFDDRLSGSQTIKRVHALSLGLNGQTLHDGGAASRGWLTLTLGRLQLDDAAAATDATAYQTAGRYARLAFQGEHEQGWSGGLSAALRLGGQVADRNLESSEKISLGGPQGVRAYATGAAACDDALLASVELRQQVGYARLKLFIDQATGRPAHDPLPNDAARRHLGGAGLGVDLHLPPQWLTLQAAVAWRTGPAQDIDNDQRQPQFWLQVVRQF